MKIWKMKKIKIMAVTLVVIGLVGLTTIIIMGDSSQDEASTQEDQIWTVQRGNLSVVITAAGNLALAKTEDLAFDIPTSFSKTSSITVEEVLVEVGDSVQEGQELVKLDTTEWDKQVKTLEKALVTARRNLTAKQSALTAKQSALTKAERQLTAKELAVNQAQLRVQSAENNAKKADDLKWAYYYVDAAKFELRVAQATNDWQMVLYWQDRLAQAREDLKETLGKYSSAVESSDDAALEAAQSLLDIKQSQMDLEDAQLAIEDAQLALEDAQLALDNAKLDVEDAQQNVEDTQSDLDEAKSLSPIILAPFDGFITKINVKGGDEVLKGTVAMQIADPNKFEAEIAVSEIDISQVKLGGESRVEVDALGVSLPAVVTYIAPTATIQSGVVNYKVKVELQSLEALEQEQQKVRQEAMENIEQGELPERLKQAIEEGQITREQAEEMMKQLQQGEEGQQAQAPTMIAEDLQLREGLTVTVSIIVQQKTDVLLVPNGAITRKGNKAYVQVVTPDGGTEERLIQTGSTDYTNTEVTEGLSEGEQIIVPEGTTTTTTTTEQEGPPGGGIMIPGMGGPPR